MYKIVATHLPSLVVAGAFVVASLGLPVAAFAQGVEPAHGLDPAHSPILIAAYTDNPPEPVRPAHVLGKVAASCATINVTYVDFTAQAQTAFQHAVDIWKEHVCSPVPINVQANWEPLSSGVLGSAGANGYSRDFTGAPMPGTWFPVPLVDALYGSNTNGTTADIVTRFNSDFDHDNDGTLDWYFGTDGGTPFDKWDLVSVVLHELGHGLGFAGSMKYDDGTGSTECDGVTGSGCWGGGTGFPVVYDRFTEDVNEDSHVNTAIYPNPSLALGDALQSENVYFDGAETRSNNGDARVDLYAPSNYERGSSYSHLDETTFNGSPSSLMTPKLFNGEVIHSPGPVTCAVFRDLGWTLGAGCTALLPVELVAFESVVDGRDVTLRWETASETGNAGFEVQRRQTDALWQTMGYVEGAGTTTEAQQYTYSIEDLTPGRHRFRLKQTDFDGSFDYSSEVEVAIAVAGTFHLSAAYPNPFHPRTQFSLAVARDQHVRVAVFDALGRHVATIYEGQLEADRVTPFVFEAADLPSGIYFVRATGETFAATRKLTLLR